MVPLVGGAVVVVVVVYIYIYAIEFVLMVVVCGIDLVIADCILYWV